MEIQTADTVKHLPTGETWTVAYVDGDELSPVGFPLSFAKASDCKLIERADFDVKIDLLSQLARMAGDDPRTQHARRELYRISAAMTEFYKINFMGEK